MNANTGKVLPFPVGHKFDSLLFGAYCFHLACQDFALVVAIQVTPGNMTTNLEIRNKTLTFTNLLRMTAQAGGDQLESLVLEDVTIQGNQGDLEFLRFLRGHPHLTALTFSAVKIVEAGAIDLDVLVSALLVSAPHLTTLSIADCPDVTTALQCVGYSSGLKSLDWESTTLQDSDAMNLATAVAQMVSLEKLSLASAEMTDAGRQAFVRAIEKSKNSKIQSLKVGIEEVDMTKPQGVTMGFAKAA